MVKVSGGPLPAGSLSTYADLVAEIEKLGPPSPGCVRVFRGQTKDHRKMLPSGLRGQIGNHAVWHYYAMLLARELLTVHNEKSQRWVWDKDAMWIEAVAQHYGPGSKFLDSTRCLHIALWFALHEWQRITGHHTLGPLGAEDPDRDIIHTESWAEYRKWDGEPGFLYVFDVPEWRQGSLQHGHLLDLSKAHPIFSQSKRIEAQNACLIASDPTIGEGDLSSFFACDPLRVQWPMHGGLHLDAPMENMFPDPSEDQWYARLIAVPLTYQSDPTEDCLGLARPMEVTLYHYSAPNKTEEICRRIKFVSPTRHDLPDTLAMELPNGPSSERTKFRLNEATHILLETPILKRLRADPERWNHSILAGDMSDSVQVFDPLTNDARGSVSLKNVYFQFSPLEVPDWEELTDAKTQIQVPGGLWIGVEGAHFVVQVFPRLVTGTKVQTGYGVSLDYDYSATNGKFWRFSIKNRLWTVVVGDRQLDGAFFAALALLRFLSPQTKADPIVEEKLSDDGRRTLNIPVRQEAARLVRVFEEKNGREWYVPRDVASKAPFFEPTACIGSLLLESRVPWACVDASCIRRDIAEQCSAPKITA